tara:strand:+ start:2626 stop:4080 length:1455 start_codon:yes stop_codon:yes gene_type:complete
MHICVIGTGASGLMAACALKEQSWVERVTLIGSPKIPTIGVGESTTLNFEKWNRKFLNNFSDFIRESDAAVKYGVYYEGWNPGRGWLHHFKSEIQTESNGITQFDYGILLGNKPEDVYIHDIYGKKLFEYATNNQVVVDREKYADEFPFSWHFDAGKYIKFLLDICIMSDKVRVVFDTVVDCKYHTENNIESISGLTLESGTEVTADFYINSTGAKSDVFKEDYVSLSDVLLTDRALFYPLEYTDREKQLHPYTIAKTMNHGWRWITPTASRIGTGYAFSSQHVSDDDAIKEFVSDIGDDSIQPNIVDFKPRYNTRPYKANSITLGMANGFLEPLDAPGLSISIMSLENVMHYLSYLDNRLHIQTDLHNPNHPWNDIVEINCEENIDMHKWWAAFILTQYKTCHRKDTDFWFDHSTVQWDYQDNLMDNLTNQSMWPDCGASMMFHQTIAARNIQWYTPTNELPFLLRERTATTTTHANYLFTAC